MTPDTPRRYTLPTVALVLSILGVCLCPLAVVGIVMAIVALVRISREPGLPGQGRAIAALVIPVGMIPVMGILAAIAIPNFIKFQSRAKQSECKAELRALYVAQEQLFASEERYTQNAAELGSTPKEQARYRYVLSADAPEARLMPTSVSEKLGLRGTCPECSITIACVGQLDQDDTRDVWTVSSEERTTVDGATVPRGTPHNDVNDVSE